MTKLSKKDRVEFSQAAEAKLRQCMKDKQEKIAECYNLSVEYGKFEIPKDVLLMINVDDINTRKMAKFVDVKTVFSTYFSLRDILTPEAFIRFQDTVNQWESKVKSASAEYDAASQRMQRLLFELRTTLQYATREELRDIDMEIAKYVEFELKEVIDDRITSG